MLSGDTVYIFTFPFCPLFVCFHQEVENYRTAMCKMAEDILSLRSQVSSLETENSQLRSELSLHQDLGRTLLEDTDLDVMTKAEITDRISKSFFLFMRLLISVI